MPQGVRSEKCIDLVQGHFEGRLEDLKVTDPEDENYIEGLCFDYVEPNTFTDQKEGYWRWQLSCHLQYPSSWSGHVFGST